jgi:phosphatidylglycerol:prolipoprotein diacylglycerol transferase
MAIKFPEFDPVIINIIGPLSVTWYSLAYVTGIMIGWYYINWLLNRKLILNYQITDNLINYAILGILIGGRLGYVLFYDLQNYLEHPLEIIKTWKGGMSFHGGLIGLGVAIYIFARKYKIPFLILADLISCAAPIGIFFGRIANFINGELFGRATNVPWAIYFESNPSTLLHPSQLYEAATEGLLIFITQFILISKSNLSMKKGFLFASFLMQYSIYRFISEFFRMPDMHLGTFYNLTMGQILSIPMFLISLYLFYFSCKVTQND